MNIMIQTTTNNTRRHRSCRCSRDLKVFRFQIGCETNNKNIQDKHVFTYEGT